ncbi:MAG: type II toxin-antitoxin system MqsA family antitoxin [Desulfosporosinus sp.]|nr:type II toxin-antitoxin system MqsA family antitoxin [Desulfosporosinus sp.]
MKILKTEQRLCLSCMEEHNVNIVEVEEQEIYKDLEVEFISTYEYCADSQEYIETEDMIRTNRLAMKDAYRRKVGLLTSNDIKNIREKYGISQKEFSEILNWGKATITRYENHQIQNKAHDDILSKIDSDPKWFLEMLERAKERISPKLYSQYYQKALEQYNMKNNPYYIKTITTNIRVSEMKLVNAHDEKYIKPTYKNEICSNFSYLSEPVFIENPPILILAAY